MPDAAPLKVSSLDLLALFGLQVGTGILCAVIVELLPFDAGSGSWIGGVAAMIGAMTFATLKARKAPEGLARSYRRSLALRVTIVQTVLGMMFLAVALPSSPELMAAGKWIVLWVPIGAVLVFGLTLWGLGMGAQQAAAMARRPPL
jgi:hypothetical protein